MSEERRRTRKWLSVLKGILYTVLGFFSILVYLLVPVANRTAPLYLHGLLIACLLGIVACYWALGEFLSAYKDKDDLMN